MKTKIKMATVIIGCLLLAVLLGIMVTRASADGPVIWKQFCPAHYEIQQIKDGPGVTVLCVRAAQVLE